MKRIDVFSAKGGVGKTTVAFRLARKWAEESKRPVLLVDADLSGTCLGDLLEWEVDRGWHEHRNLIHLVCGLPEDLPEELGFDRIPVYELRLAPDGSPPQHVRPGAAGATVLFCPSHAETHFPVPGGMEPVDLAVLQALLGHESAGGWVGHVIEQVIDATSKGIKGGLAGTVVDHGPGIGALQWSQMGKIEAELEKGRRASGPSQRQALFVASRDQVDLAAARAIDDRLGPGRPHPMGHLRTNGLWALNRLPAAWASGGKDEWRALLEGTLRHSPLSTMRTDVWFRNSLPLFEDPDVSNAYAGSGLAAYYDSHGDAAIDAIYQRTVGKTTVEAPLS